LHGTFTLANGTTGFTLPTACGGSAGNPVLIQFDSGALWQAGYFSGSGSIVVDNLSNLVIDGTGATIQNTTNGSPTATCLSGVACSTQQPSKFLDAIACTNCEFRNLTVQDLYIHTQCEAASGCDTAISNTDVVGIHYGGDGLLVHNNTFHDVSWVFYGYTGTVSNQSFYNNNVYNMDHGLACGANASGAVITNLFVYNNHFHDMANWDTGNADAYHHDYIHCWSATGGKIQNLYVYSNTFDGNEGNCCVTAMIYLEGSTGPAWTDTTGTAYIFNNVLLGSLDVPNSNVFIAAGTGHKFLNNTLIVASPAGGGCLGFYQSATNVTVENNAIEGCNVLINSISASSFSTIDYNVYGNASGGNNIFSFASKNSNTLSGWQNACGCDAHSFAQSPLSAPIADLSSTGNPTAGYAGIGTAANLNGLATGALGSLASDASTLTIGAMQISAGLNPPTSLAASVQ
jgi:hypothetical protein